MTRKKIFQFMLLIIGVVALSGAGIGYYMFNMPHRDVQASKADYSLQASRIVNEYLEDPEKADQKYLDSEGDSKIIEVTGNIYQLSKDFAGNTVVILKSEADKAGVSCTFSPETNSNATSLQIGHEAILKGVIRSGASYDSDLIMYEDVIIEKCDLIKIIK
jgi:hypothetical protein